MSSNFPIVTSSRPDVEQELLRRMPRLQTTPSSQSTTINATIHPEQMVSTPIDPVSAGDPTPKSPSSSGHQRFILTDPIAFKYLEQDSSTEVFVRRQKLQGYELYLVEQWACSRNHPTFIITTYTGDPKDTVWGSVISVPTDEKAWSPQLRIYFQALNQYHARRKETEQGTLMITNLSGFPSSLTVIPIPEGDATKNREIFFVNENLKRLGCSGRLGIKLAPPSSATQAKFHQLYRTSDKIPLNSSVIELVKLCQVALVMFGVLPPEYADGLLCDVTEKAVNDWWVEFGAEYYAVEPHDGILGPTTVAGLLGMLMGARNRLSAFNAPVAKDVFDIDSTKRAIAYFQKTQRIHKTRRLDRQTLERLRKATAKAASKEGWAMQRALKTTVAELGGKGGEMVMGMVGAGEKAGIADVETIDIDRFVELVHGERAKWLWKGKPRKTTSGDMFSRLPGEEAPPLPDEQRHHATRLLKKETTLEGNSLTKRDTNQEDTKKYYDAFGILEGVEKEKDLNSKRAAIKRATDKIESGSGFNRIKDVVGRRNHQTKPPKDDSDQAPFHHTKSDFSPQATNSSLASLAPILPRLLHDPKSEIKFTESLRNLISSHEPSSTGTFSETLGASASSLGVGKLPQQQFDSYSESSVGKRHSVQEHQDPSYSPTKETSIAGSVYRGVDLTEIFPDNDPFDLPPLLRRTQSSLQLDRYHANARHDDWWPRNLSFSIAEENILTWPSITSEKMEDSSTMSMTAALATQQLVSQDVKRLRHRLAMLSSIDAEWVDSRLKSVHDIEVQVDEDIGQLEDMYFPRLEEYQTLREDAHEIVSRERVQLQESVRDLETLAAKLDYEIHTLRGKVDDVDDGAVELERQVAFVEAKFAELEGAYGAREGWVHWGFRILTGIGRPPG
ncbi:hypothetical protein K504DRAFT_462044 [Pleomassaria siparia CBS 279.74]|uniref:STB6-like N-terminal domain-containing protein n=1 Tax=Pleomassaria siparia CBS 279.74 TaxID=1314801 RepID=A0A6G1KMG6_9PLEO|nr:hypothetical protein K504DRAFT_462044 [Pleomassaria siparia CBS 279.74]